MLLGLGTGLCHPVCTEEMKPKVITSVNQIPWNIPDIGVTLGIMSVLQEVQPALCFRICPGQKVGRRFPTTQ